MFESSFREISQAVGVRVYRVTATCSFRDISRRSGLGFEFKRKDIPFSFRRSLCLSLFGLDGLAFFHRPAGLSFFFSRAKSHRVFMRKDLASPRARMPPKGKPLYMSTIFSKLDQGLHSSPASIHSQRAITPFIYC